MKRSILMTALCLFVLVACDKKDEPKPDDRTTTTNATGTSPATAAPTPISVAETDLSTPADFEEAAEKTITAQNYKQELSTLEADIAKE